MKSFILKSVLIFLSLTSIEFVAVCQVNSKEDVLNKLYENIGEQYFSFQVAGRADIEALSRIISIDNVDKTGKVYAYANRKEFSHFLDFRLPYEILPHPGHFDGFLNMKDEVDIRNIQEWDFYPTYDAYVDMMYQFAADYPALCQVFSIGNTNNGRQLLVAKISDNIGIKETEPQFLYTSSIHGDELTGYILMLRLIDYLLSNYGTDPKVTNMVDNAEIWINPLANPDGTYYGGNSSVNNAIRYNANFVDMNRNYPDPEDGPHPDGEDWQTETLHFMEMAENNHFVISTNFHGGAEVCNYPWDTWQKLAADDLWWKYVCHEYADTVQAHSVPGYMSDFDDGISNGYAWYTLSGGRQDYMNYFQQCRELTIEISNTKLPDPETLPDYWEYNYRSLLNYIEQSTFGIRGTVKDSVTGFPLKAEVYVVLHEMDSSWVYSSLPNGNYHRLLIAGNYSVKFTASGYVTKVINNVSVINRQATILDVKLVPNGVGGIDDNLTSKMIQIFPNPLNGNFLHYKSDIPVKQISVYDITGKEIKQISVDRFTREIDLQALNSGLYFIRFDTEKGPGLKKIAINH
jgi:hypothetical protein